MTTLAEAILALARIVDEVTDSISTSSTTTTLVDNTLALPDKWFDRGTIWFISGTLAGKSAVVSAFAQGTHTFTFPTQTASPGTGITYAACRARFPRNTLIGAVNLALAQIGKTTQVDDTLDSVENQEEYTLPSGVSNVVRVDVTYETSAPYQYKTNYWWREVGGSLIFDNGKAPSADGTNNIRLYYNAPHPTLSADADPIRSRIHPARLAWTAAYYAVIGRMRLAGNDEPHLAELLKLCQYNMEMMAIKHPVYLMPSTPHLPQ